MTRGSRGVENIFLEVKLERLWKLPSCVPLIGPRSGCLHPPSMVFMEVVGRDHRSPSYPENRPIT